MLIVILMTLQDKIIQNWTPLKLLLNPVIHNSITNYMLAQATMGYQFLLKTQATMMPDYPVMAMLPNDELVINRCESTA